MDASLSDIKCVINVLNFMSSMSKMWLRVRFAGLNNILRAGIDPEKQNVRPEILTAKYCMFVILCSCDLFKVMKKQVDNHNV